MCLTNKIKLVVVPQSFPVGKLIEVQGEQMEVVRTLDFCLLHFPKNGNVTIEINYKSYSDKSKLNQLFVDAGFVSIVQFIQQNSNIFYVDTNRILGRFKAVIVSENYSIFGE